MSIALPPAPRIIMGIRIGHDAGAALIVDGRIVADAAEERFTRVKNDGSFPVRAIAFCLKQAGCDSRDLDALVFPSLNYVPPAVFALFKVPVQSGDWPADPWCTQVTKRPTDAQVPPLPVYMEPWPLSPHCRILTVHHHLAHAASAYLTSGLYDDPALVVTMDGIGDASAVTLWRAHRNRFTSLRRWDQGASLGWFYAAATEALGWRHGSDEWKTMGLAPYGKPSPGALSGFHPEFADGELVRAHDYGEPGRWPDHGVNHYHLRDAVPLQRVVDELGREDFAAETQRTAEEIGLAVVLPWLRREGVRNLCCAGGCFLNVKLNQRLWYTGALDRQWIFPNPGDAGLPAGLALYVYYATHPDQPAPRLEQMYFGPSHETETIRRILVERGLRFEEHANIADVTAGHLAENRIIAWFQGRMESGPRALGNRSILMSPLRAENKDIINEKVKYREPFRPFCPSMLHERAADYLVQSREEPFMVTSFDVKPDKRAAIPAVVHVDGTARPQTVRKEVNPRYHDLIRAFGERTGHPVILNTSLNVKGEPMICHPREAIRCFFDTGIDVLVLDRFLVRKPALGG